MDIITGTPFAEPRNTFNDLPLAKQFLLHKQFAQKADDERIESKSPKSPVFLIAPEYTYTAHPRDADGNVTHRFLPNHLKKHVLSTIKVLSEKYPKVVFIFSIAWAKRITSSDAKTEGRNTTYVYYNGRKVFSQHKNGDAGELLPGDIKSGIRYRNIGDPISQTKKMRQPIDGVFTIEGKPFGIETCCDFGCRLPNSLAAASSLPIEPRKLAGQFLISSTINHTQSAKDAAKLGINIFRSDWFFHNDGRKDLWQTQEFSHSHFSEHFMGGFKVHKGPKGIGTRPSLEPMKGRVKKYDEPTCQVITMKEID